LVISINTSWVMQMSDCPPLSISCSNPEVQRRARGL
jgi:hypothetical protein